MAKSSTPFDTITFQADSVKGLRKAFCASVNDYLAFCAKRGEQSRQTFFRQVHCADAGRPAPPRLHRM